MRARSRLTSFKILFYLYFRKSASSKEIIRDLKDLDPFNIKNRLSELKKHGLLTYANGKYHIDPHLEAELSEIHRIATGGIGWEKK